MSHTKESTLPARSVLGVRVNAATMDDAVAICHDAIRRRDRLMVGVVNAAKVVNMGSDEFLCKAVSGCDVVFADGQAVVWASRMLGSPLPERVAGIDLFTNLLALGDREELSVFLLGATREVLDTVCERVRKEHPNLRIAGSQDGYFTDAESEDVAKTIRDSGADMLFVAITSPKKEIFLDRYGDLMDVPVCHGVGGSFDVLAGKVKRAPALWQKLGMEWLYRVVQEPGRMWKRYLVTNSKFVWLVIKNKITGRERKLATDSE